MRRNLVVFLTVLTLLAGCGGRNELLETQMTEPLAAETQVATQAATQPAETKPVMSETVLSYLELYRPILELYAQAQTEQWDGQQFTAAGLSNQAYGWLSVQQKLGWGLVDLDADGVMELLIGDCETSFLVDGYRLNDGIPEQLFMAVTKLEQPQYEDLEFLYDEWYLCRDQKGEWYLYHQVQQDWLICGYFPVWLKEGALQVPEGFVYNSIVDEFNPWYRVDGYILDYKQGEPVTQRQDVEMALYNHESAMVSMNSLENSWLISDSLQ